VGNSCRNLFAKYDCRATLADEPKPYWPQVAFVCFSFLLSGGAKGLAGATSCPNRSSVIPSGKAQGNAPSADSGEEVTLIVSFEIGRLHIYNAPFVHIAGRNKAICNKLAEHVRRWRVEFVIISRHVMPSS
jgi:hypothetical protein